MQRSRIDEILLHEGLRWRKHETWFGERVDPAFAEKRGRSRRSTLPRLRAVSWSAWTRWGRRAPRAIPGRALVQSRDATGRASQAGDRLWPARQGLHLRCVPPRHRRGLHASLSRPRQRPLGGLPGGGRELAPERDRAGLRHPGQPELPPRHGRAAVPAGASALGDGVPAQVRRLSQPDRAVVEDPALAGAGGPALRDLGGDRRGDPRATAYWNAHRHPFVWGKRRRHRPRRSPGIALLPKAA